MTAQLTVPTFSHTLPGYELPPVPATGTRIILLRHGRSTLNDAGRYQGSQDAGQLTPRGRSASQAVGAYLAQCPIAKIYTSPLRRAQQTVKALLPYLNSYICRDPIVSPLLREIHLPDWEGQPYATVRSHDAATYHCWQTTPERLQMGSEHQPFYPVQDVYDRARQFWETTLPHHRGQTVLVVGHGSSNQALLNTAIGLTSQQHHLCQQTHSGLTVLDFADVAECTAHLRVLNATLDGCLPKLKSGKQGLRILLFPIADSDQTTMDCPLLPDITLNAILVAKKKDATYLTAQETAIAQSTTQSMLHQHPEAVMLSIDAEQMSHWSQSIQRSLAAPAHATFTTVLAIAPLSHIQTYFHHLLQLPQPLPTLTVNHHSLSVIHYPAPERSPILQGLNLSQSHIV
jgi:probable phosphoglycerate mutase